MKLSTKALLTAGIIAVTGLIPVAEPFAQGQRTGFDISVRGIEDGVKALSEVRGNAQAQQAALVLTLLRGVGKQMPAEGGRSRLDYRVDITPDGHVVINNLDVSVIINAVQGKKG